MLLIRNNTLSLCVSTPQSASLTAPLDKGGREGSALNRRSTTLRTTQSLLPPLAKGRTVRGTVRCNPGAATINHGGPPKAVEGWERSKERYRNDRGNLLRLHPSVACGSQKNQCALSRLGFDRSVPRTLRPLGKGSLWLYGIGITTSPTVTLTTSSSGRIFSNTSPFWQTVFPPAGSILPPA